MNHLYLLSFNSFWNTSVKNLSHFSESDMPVPKSKFSTNG